MLQRWLLTLLLGEVAFYLWLTHRLDADGRTAWFIAGVKAWLESSAPNRFLNRFGLCVPRSFHRRNGPKMNSVSRRWAIDAANIGW